MELAGAIALVTGGAHGIGRAIAEALADRGARVVIADLHGGDLLVDLTQEGEPERMIDETVRRYGRIDVLVNNAGGYESPTFPEAPAAHWRRTLELNLGAVMAATHHALPLMAGGVIVSVASSAGLGTIAHPGVEYAVAKAGVIRFTSALAGAGARMNVRVNCVCPHTVATEAVLAALETRPVSEVAPHAARVLELAEVADAVLRLVEDESLNGRTIVLWGGEPPRLVPGGLREGAP